MTDTASGSRISITRLILMPAVITLAVTILRLVGELKHWPKPWFSAGAGGGGAIIGITWLAFIFGPYFALKLARAGEGPTSSGKAIGFAVLGLIAAFGGAFLAFAPKVVFPGKIAVGLLVMVVGAALQFNPWSALAKTLVAYGYAARIPVAIVMFCAIKGNWGTHYDAPPPGFPETSFWPKYVQIALVPQLVFWVVFTVIVGALFGAIVTAIAHPGKPATQTAASR